MALNIPIPGLPADALLRGVNTGGGLYSRIMQPILEREQQEIRKRQLEEQKRQFAEQMGLRREQFARSGQNMDLQRAILGEQLQNLQHKNDPNWEMNNFINFSKKLGGIENIKSNPMLKGLIKHAYGVDLDKESPEQKNQSYVDRAISIDEAKSNRKKLDEIEKTAQSLLPFANNIQTIENILTNKPDITGRSTQIADALGLTKDKDVGAFISAAQNLQAHMAKELSNRGGYGVSKLVEQGKPNIGKSAAFNKGVIQELKISMKESFNQMKNEYERLSNGKKFPYDFEKYFKEITGSKNHNIKGESIPMISPNGKKVIIPTDKVDAALAAGGKYA